MIYKGSLDDLNPRQRPEKMTLVARTYTAYRIRRSTLQHVVWYIGEKLHPGMEFQAKHLRFHGGHRSLKADASQRICSCHPGGVHIRAKRVCVCVVV